MENKSIGARIKQRRKELGLTQIQIKQATGISSGNLSEIENGSKLPSSPALISLSAILSCSTDWILKGEISRESNAFLSDAKECCLLEGFRQLPEEEKKELLEILDIKLRKSQNTKSTNTKSSRLTSTGNTDIAG